MLILRNVAAGAPWTPRFYVFDRNSGSFARADKVISPGMVGGLGSSVLEVCSGRLARRMLAIYMIAGKWMIFDGEKEFGVNELSANWKANFSILGGFGLASFSLKHVDSVKIISYFRPWFRHWFEGGWGLNDVDIACIIAASINDEAVRDRLQQSLGLFYGI